MNDLRARGLERGTMRAAVAAAVIAGFLGGAVVSDDSGLKLSANAAFAKGGNGGGNGGGRGGGNKGGRGDSAGGGIAHARGHGHGHDNGTSDPPGAPTLGGVSATERGISAAALGSLNAAHASPRAREKAAPNSMVGHIAAFEAAVKSGQVEAAAQALAAKANKPVSEPVVRETARLAGVELTDDAASAIAQRAAEIQAADNDNEAPAGPAFSGGS